MNLQQFQYILAVAEYKHFELASEKCSITQSTLSTMISKFEDEIGFKIFDRKKKPVSLTFEGQIIIEQLKIITNNIDQLKELTKAVKGEVSGNLTLSVIPTIAPFLLPVFLQDFASQFPNLTIKIREETTTEIMRKLKSRELDIGILSIPLNDTELIESKLYDEPFLYYDAEQLESKYISAKTISMKNMYLMEEGHCMRTQVLQLCDLNEKVGSSKLNFEYKAGSIDSLLRFVKTNKATTLLPLLATLDFSADENKHLSKFANPAPFRSVGLVVHRHFVKKKLLAALLKDIQLKILPLLPTMPDEGPALNPLG
jgi:LysR family hydrogen peroxide-inducible transcriptional activator